ncbi:MAG: ABC transporter substrate-binding protein [Rhodospirillales bacterium]|nr:ABC transporter substrate-binding protein [Rhodospirillales bacterium]
MLNRRLFLTFVGSFAGAVALLPDQTFAAEDDDEFEAGARTFIEHLADDALVSLTQSGLETDQRRERFRQLMHQYFAFNVIAKWVLGRYWRRASDPQRKEYLALFEKLMVITYADRFEKYAGEKLKIQKTEVRAEKDALVHSVLQRPDGQKAVAVVWRVRPKDDSYKVVDVMVEGLSMGITQQKEFSSVIRQHDNKVEGLLDELRKRVKVDT